MHYRQMQLLIYSQRIVIFAGSAPEKKIMTLTPLAAMKNRYALSDAIRAAGSLFLLGASMCANAGLFGFGGTSWKEEVLLHDGSRIVVERWAKRGGRHEIGQPPAYQEQTLSFSMPETGKTVKWEDHLSEDLGSSSFLPMAVGIISGTAYVVTTPMGCFAYNKWGRPNPPYVVFKHTQSGWERISLNELPSEVRTPNLVISDPDTKAEKLNDGLVTANEVNLANTGYRQLEYRTILREPVKGGEGSSVNCPDYSSPRYMSPKAPNPI